MMQPRLRMNLSLDLTMVIPESALGWASTCSTQMHGIMYMSHDSCEACMCQIKQLLAKLSHHVVHCHVIELVAMNMALGTCGLLRVALYWEALKLFKF